MVLASDQPLVAERAMWWGSPWYEGDVSQGTTETRTMWAIGEGVEGGPAYASGRRFSVIVESLAGSGPATAPITVECARYQSPGRRFGPGGGAALASRIR
jgi:hypothetical protein